MQVDDLTATISDLESKAHTDQAATFARKERCESTETLYEVLIKQFESRSLTSGIPGKTAQFFERAKPALDKSEPSAQ